MGGRRATTDTTTAWWSTRDLNPADPPCQRKLRPARTPWTPATTAGVYRTHPSGTTSSVSRGGRTPSPGCHPARGFALWTRSDSNRQPSACKAAALPLELQAHEVGTRPGGTSPGGYRPPACTPPTHPPPTACTSHERQLQRVESRTGRLVEWRRERELNTSSREYEPQP